MNIFEILLFLLPTYVANAAPILLGDAIPLDYKKLFLDKKRLLGDNKSIGGFFGGVLAGIVCGGIITIYFRVPYFRSVEEQFIGFSLMSVGALVGDALGSFIKRRLNIEEGKSHFTDQTLFLLMALIFSSQFINFEALGIYNLAFMFIITYFLHILSNRVANKLGLKKVPW